MITWRLYTKLVSCEDVALHFSTELREKKNIVNQQKYISLLTTSIMY